LAEGEGSLAFLRRLTAQPENLTKSPPNILCGKSRVLSDKRIHDAQGQQRCAPWSGVQLIILQEHAGSSGRKIPAMDGD